MLRTPEEARAAIQRTGVPITQWAIANGFSPNLCLKCWQADANPCAARRTTSPWPWG